MDQKFMKEKPILPLVISMALPMVISMAINSLMHIHLCRRCIPQMMAIQRYFILKMAQLHFHHLHMNRKL